MKSSANSLSSCSFSLTSHWPPRTVRSFGRSFMFQTNKFHFNCFEISIYIFEYVSDNEIILFIQRSHFLGMQFENMFILLCRLNNYAKFVLIWAARSHQRGREWNKKHNDCYWVICVDQISSTTSTKNIHLPFIIMLNLLSVQFNNFKK